ncbi:MAG: nuclear transport factor 2 family protein [Gammaproteobacteria bacterium]|nr:nuclear transport factor 2 family protein [Gammaproteobacteria bacterium]
MGIIDRFESFAADFEAAVENDDWSRLEKYLTEDATYWNVGGPDPKCEGRDAIIAFLKADVSNTDQRFDTRTLIALTPPTVDGNRLSRQWRCTYTLAGMPDLTVEGEARYLFEGGLIKEIEEEITAASMHKLSKWMRAYGDGLHA